MGRGEQGDSHPIINEWGSVWVVPEPGEGMSLPGSVTLEPASGAGHVTWFPLSQGRSWADSTIHLC
jgi:hypothetical protein